jgi:hypothetical protein
MAEDKVEKKLEEYEEEEEEKEEEEEEEEEEEKSVAFSQRTITTDISCLCTEN